jgi:DNA-binding MarR family transcriptional regulator
VADYFDILEHSQVRFGYRIAVLGNWYRLPGYKLIEQKFGIIEPECSVLFCVGHADRLTASDVCHITGRPKNSISRAISLLIDKKLLARTTDDLDGRKKRLALTPKGRVLYEKIVPIFLKTEQNIVQPLTPSELSDLDRLLSKMIRHVVDTAHTY